MQGVGCRLYHTPRNAQAGFFRGAGCDAEKMGREAGCRMICLLPGLSFLLYTKELFINFFKELPSWW